MRPARHCGAAYAQSRVQAETSEIHSETYSQRVIARCQFPARDKRLSGKKCEARRVPAPTIPRGPGHHAEWIHACKGGPKPFSPFEIGASLTEMIKLGIAALLTGHPIEYDATNPKMPNRLAANALLRRDYREAAVGAAGNSALGGEPVPGGGEALSSTFLVGPRGDIEQGDSEVLTPALDIFAGPVQPTSGLPYPGRSELAPILRRPGRDWQPSGQALRLLLVARIHPGSSIPP